MPRLTINGKDFTGTIDTNGDWSVEIDVPEAEDTYEITVKAGDQTKTGSITVNCHIDLSIRIKTC